MESINSIMGKRPFNIGDEVEYTRGFLQSIYADYEIASLTGLVQSIKHYPNINRSVVKVLWSNGELTGCLSSNIIQTNKLDPTGF
jgi:hypothetical protein